MAKEDINQPLSAEDQELFDRVEWKLETETCGIEEIICPHCGHITCPGDDPSYYYELDEEDIECGDCGKEFTVTADHITEFTAYIKEKK